MWQTKKFKTREKLNEWLQKNGHRSQYNQVFVNNGYAVEWRKLKKITVR